MSLHKSRALVAPILLSACVVAQSLCYPAAATRDVQEPAPQGGSCKPLAASGDSPYNEFPPRPYGLGPDSAWGDLTIQAPGRYCLKNDLSLHKALAIAEGGWKKSHATAVLTLYVGADAGDGSLDIDLGSHVVGSRQEGMTGVSSTSNWPVSIHDGSIRLAGRAIGVNLEPDLPTSNPPSFRLHDVAIRTGGTGVKLSGRGSVIRHCVIEVESQAAIDAAGEGLLIEDNTIIVHGGVADQPPIVLRHADGAIVRRNKIFYAHFFGPDRASAVRLEDSKHVQMLDNTLQGFTTLLSEEHPDQTPPAGSE